MIGKSGAGKKPVAPAEALEILEGRKEAGELGYEQKLAYDHIKKFTGIAREDATKMAKELVEQGITESTAVKVIEVMPIDMQQLRQILAREKKTFEEEQITKMWGIVESHRGK